MRKMLVAIGLLAAFAVWTVLVCLVDVQPIGPLGTSVGLATFNRAVHEWTGVHLKLYVLTDWMELIPLGICVGFGALGLWQWIKRKKLRYVDRSIIVLGGFYLVTIAAFVLFEQVVINYRPILIEGCLEASYPSSTTMLVLCVMPAAMLQLKGRIGNKAVRNIASVVMAVYTAFMVLGRLVSGVHWASDIIGSVLVSASLVFLYYAVEKRLK